MLAPKLEGRILQALELQPDDAVLEIGTGSGYFAACLGALARTGAIGRDLCDLATAARANLLRTDVHNVAVEAADAFALADDTRYDAVVLSGSLPGVRPALRTWAGPVGGRAVRGGRPGSDHGGPARHLYAPGQWLRESLFETVMDR